MKMFPAVSVVIAARDAERTIAQCLCSVLDQDVPSMEVVVCDDASNDGTSNIVRSFDDNRIVLLEAKSRIGAGPARDWAIAESRNEWIALIDADDAWLPGRLARLLSFTDIEKNAIIFDDLFDCHDSPDGLVPFRRVYGPKAFGSGPSIRKVSIPDYLGRPRLLAHPIFSRQLVDQVEARHGSRTSGQDLDFRFALLAGGGTLYYVPEAYYLYRLSPGSLSSQVNRASLYLEIFKENRDKYNWPESIVRAFKVKEAKVRRLVKRRGLAQILQQRRYGDAFAYVIREPVAAIDFLANLIRHFPYHVNRRWHRAPARD